MSKKLEELTDEELCERILHLKKRIRKASIFMDEINQFKKGTEKYKQEMKKRDKYIPLVQDLLKEIDKCFSLLMTM